MIQGNLAHAYLFANNYAKAIILYKEHLNEKLGDGTPWTKMIQNDFIYFKNEGFDKSLMIKVFTDLKLEIPVEFK